MTSWRKRSAWFLAAAGIGLVAGAPTLAAGAGPVVGDHSSDPTTISCSTGSLNLTLPQPNPYNVPEPGELKDPTGTGFTITARRVKGVDITDPHQWDRVSRFTVDDANAAGFEASEFRGVTDAHAKVTFTHMPVGLYLVEGQPPVDPKVKISELPPFLVSVPISDGKSWDCSVAISAKTHYSVQPKPTPETPTPRETPSTPPSPSTPPPAAPGKQTKLSFTGASVLGAAGLSVLLLGIGVGARRAGSAKGDLGVQTAGGQTSGRTTAGVPTLGDGMEGGQIL